MGSQHILRAAALHHTAGGGGTPWPEALPESSAALEGWWDFSTLAEGAPVSSHPNSASTAAWPLLQATSGSRPIGKANIQNGLSVARCDGVDDFLDALDGSARLTGNLISVVIVAIRRGTPNQPALVSLGVDASSTEFTTAGGALIAFESGGDRHVNYRNGGGLAVIGTHPGNGVAFRVTTVWDGTNNIMERSDGTSNSASDATPGFAVKHVRIGDRTPNSNAGQFDYGDVLLFNGALSVVDRAYVATQLATKWAL